MCIVTMKSTTAAQIGRRALLRKGIYADIVSVDPALTGNGCTIGLSIPCSDIKRAKSILADNNVIPGRVLGYSG